MSLSVVDEAFERDALACLPHVARFALSLTRDEPAADDLVQETYLRAFRGRATFLPTYEMRRWLFTICKNAFLRDRERSVREPASLDADDPTNETLEAVRQHARLGAEVSGALFEQTDLGDAIIAALNALPATMRAVVVLVDQEGYGYADAAELLGVPVGTVRSRLFRARRVLQDALVHHGRDAGLVASHTHRGES